MNPRQAIATGLAVLGMAVSLHAQATSQTQKIKGEAKVEAVKMTGEVVQVSGDWLLTKMQPLGNYSLFHVQPGREFMIDGQVKHIADLKPGTVLTGTITKKETPVTVRTTSTLNGTVWWAQGNYVVLTLDSGENKEYKVPESFKFMPGSRWSGSVDRASSTKLRCFEMTTRHRARLVASCTSTWTG